MMPMIINRKYMMRLVLICLTALLMMGSTPRRTVHFNDMQYVRPDTKYIKESLQQLTDDLESAPDFYTVLTIDQERNNLIENFTTMQTLARINSHMNTRDRFYSAEFRYLSVAFGSINHLNVEFYRALIEGPFADLYRDMVGYHYFQSLEYSLQFNFDPAVVEDYIIERSGLIVDYTQLITTLTVPYRWQSFTYYELVHAARIGSNIPADRLRAQFYELYLHKFAEVFSRIVELDQRIASARGFSTAIEMHYTLSHRRDYSPYDALRLFEYVKRYFVPMMPILARHNVTPSIHSLETALDAMPQALQAIDAELVYVWESMRRYGLYDADARQNKLPGAFCFMIPAYDAPFLYVYWMDNTFRSPQLLIHEFGHFYAFWRHYDSSHTVMNTDTIEVHAHGLELLLSGEFARFTDEPEQAQRFLLANKVISSIIFQSMLEEFQIRVHELDELNAESLGRLFGELQREYGFLYNPNDWIRVMHLFSHPFYTVSYVTSAVVALQIWDVMQDDWYAAVGVYLDFVRQDKGYSFGTLLENVSLGSPHDAQVIRGIVARLGGFFT